MPSPVAVGRCRGPNANPDTHLNAYQDASAQPATWTATASTTDFDGDGRPDLATSKTRTGYDAAADAFAGGVCVLAGPDW